MREPSNCRRNAAGAAILVIACVLAALWVRSRDTTDYVYFCPNRKVIHFFISNNRGLSWETQRDTSQGAPVWDFELYEYHSDQLRDEDGEAFFQAGTTKSRYEFAGFCIGRVAGGSPDIWYECSLWQIPHWFIVMPLTLLSAHLLLMKPRPKPKRPVNHA